MKKEYSIWAIPSSKAYERLSEVIYFLSKKYYAPIFEPHITIIGGLKGEKNNLINKTEELASKINPYKAELTQISFLNDYFKSLFVNVRKTQEVIRPNFKAERIFNKKSCSEYMPHLSLIYGYLPNKTKSEIINDLGKKFNIEFDVKKFSFFLTGENPHQWDKIQDFKLS